MPPRGWAKLTAMPHAVMGVRHGWGWNGKSNVSLRVKAVRGREGLCGGYVPGRARSGKSCSRSLDKGALNGNEFRIQLTKRGGMAVRTHQRKPKEIVMSLINKEVSEFSVQAFQDNAFKTVTKADILGKWSVFFFYPADFTFVCPTELEDLAEKYEDFKSIGCEIYSVSCDSHFVHKAWHDASKTIQKIKYPMLADPTGALARDFDVMIESEGMAERGSFIVNPEGRIVAYEVIAGNVGRNADELFRRVQASQFVASHDDQVCPAKWRPGAETLKPSLDLVGLL